MRQPGSIYRKLREVRYYHLAERFKRAFKRLPENCRYFHNYSFITSTMPPQDVCIRLCLIHQEKPDSINQFNPTTVDVCSERPECPTCNTWVPRLSKEQIREKFDKELSNKDIRQHLFPDICALEWVLERSVVGFPPLPWIQKTWYSIKKMLLKNRIL